MTWICARGATVGMLQVQWFGCGVDERVLGSTRCRLLVDPVTRFRPRDPGSPTTPRKIVGRRLDLAVSWSRPIMPIQLDDRSKRPGSAVSF